MLFAVDIGNTNIVMAVHDGASWINIWRIHTDIHKTTDEYFVLLESLLKNCDPQKYDITDAVISSVVPNLNRALEKNVIRLFNINPIIINHDLKTGLVRESIPVELGSDLLCNLAQAHNLYPNKAVMVVDFGTALTMSCVNSKGEVEGVAITPGLITAVNALFGSTAQLPQVQLKAPEKAMGRSSDCSIRSGIMFGYAGLVESMIDRTEKQLGVKLHVIATGGLSSTISSLIPRIDEIEINQTLDGLRYIASLNKINN
ncbi:MAG: type III pantothenate kinase [Pleomorphochaeta sp.]|jgi:type III pantothenate kinase